MGVSSPTGVDAADGLFSRMARGERAVAAEHHVIRRAEPPKIEGRERDPLAATLEHLAQTAPPSKQPERIGRALIRATLLPKQDDLTAQRAKLVLKEFSGTLSPQEHSRLDYLTWQLEQIEEALVGDHWDIVQAAIAHQAAVAHEMQAFVAELREKTPTAFRSRK